jgi:hypothetical protein
MGSAQPPPEAKRVTFTEMAATSSDAIIKRLDALEAKIAKLTSAKPDKSSDVTKEYDEAIEKLTTVTTKLATELIELKNLIAVTNDDFEDRINELEGKSSTTKGGVDTQIQQLIGGTWYN